MWRYIRIAASLAMLFAALHLLDRDAVQFALQRISPAVFLLAVFITLIAFVVLGLRWYLIVQGISPLPAVDHLKHYLLAIFLNTFTPANLGGDVYRVMSLRSLAPSTADTVAAVVRERVVGLLFYLLAYLLLLPAAALCNNTSQWDPPAMFVYAWIAAATATLALATAPYWLTGPVFRWRVIRRYRLLAAGVELIDRAGRFGSWREAAMLAGYSIIGIALWLAALQLLAADLGIEVSWPVLGVVAVLTELLRMVPLTVQGIGLREATFAYLLSLLGGSAEQGFVLGLVGYLALTVALLGCGAIGWILLVIERTKHR